jgi:hypothetical protein
MTSRPEPGVGPTRRARGVAYGAAAAAGGAFVLAALAGPLSLGPGLLVVAAATGRVVALAVAAGWGPSAMRTGRIVTAVALALIAVALGEIGTWLFARAEGGVLELVDYLGQVHGPIAPAMAALAAATAWLSAR